mmetsp:Transcript_1229/g.2845  ORF Transcript_1229/g.2845 Transcript_1229/m.2845 type:complete len:205 (+) Transcript_1229:671-1285(+)
MHVDLAGSWWRLAVALHALLELLDERLRHLRQPALGGPIARIARSAAALDARSHRVEDVRLHSFLLLHQLQCDLSADQDANQVDLDHRLHDGEGHLKEGSAAAVDAGIVDPIVNDANLGLCELCKALHALGIGHVCNRPEDPADAIRVLLPDRLYSRLRILHVAYHHPMTKPNKFIGIRKSDTTRTTSDDEPLGGHVDGRGSRK